MSDRCAGVNERLHSLLSIQFASWLLVFVPVFVIVVVVLENFLPPLIAVFVAGMVFNEIASRGVGWFTDWWVASQTIRGDRDV